MAKQQAGPATAGKYTHIDNLAALMAEIPEESIISRTLYKDAALKVVLFGFAPGQALSEHTAAQAASIQILQGEALLTLDGESKPAGPGTWVQMAPHLRHGVYAKTAVVMLLTMITTKGGAADQAVEVDTAQATDAAGAPAAQRAAGTQP
jgi:quercetin dioxygenase-like cupin family protein